MKSIFHFHNNHNHKLCSAPFTIRSIDQRCIAVEVSKINTIKTYIDKGYNS